MTKKKDKEFKRFYQLAGRIYKQNPSIIYTVSPKALYILQWVELADLIDDKGIILDEEFDKAINNQFAADLVVFARRNFSRVTMEEIVSAGLAGGIDQEQEDEKRKSEGIV